MSTSWEYSQKKRSRQTKVAGDHLVFMSARIRQDLSVMDYNQTRQEKIIGIKIKLNKALLVSEHNGHHHKPAIKNSQFEHQQRWI